MTQGSKEKLMGEYAEMIDCVDTEKMSS